MFKLIFSLAAVTTLAQVLQLISQPLLTHLYTKESFGYLSIVVSIVSFGSIVCNFQFNNLALIEKKNVDNIFVSGLFFSLILELIFFLLLVLFSYHIFKENLFYFIFFTMLYLVFYCFNALFRAVLLKKQKNKLYSWGILIRSFVVIISQILFSFYYNYFGLIIGVVIGEFLLMILGLLLAKNIVKIRSLEIKKIAAPFLRNKKFLIIGTIQELFSTSMFIAPLLLITYNFSYAIGGEFSVVHKLSWGPAFLLTQVVSPVLLQFISNKDFKDTFLYDYKKSVLFFIFFSILIYFTSEYVFKIFLEDDWYEAIWMSKYILIWVVSFVMALPYRVLLRAEGKQIIQLYVDIFILLVFLSIFIFHFSFHNYIYLIFIFGVIGNFLIMFAANKSVRNRGWV